jgi:23S rRNA (uracil1939-C5)-methyltransferase
MKAFDPGQPDVVFRIGPASFFQTNTTQAAILYRTVAGFGDFRGDEIVYDLYSGTGTISCYLARNVKQVIGIESVHPAVQDAIINAELNGIRNAVFIPGEVEKVLEPGFTRQYGIPDIIITDPPRAGMHPDAVQAIRDLSPRKVIYVSCNPATQARDMMMLRDQFTLVRCQPVDMFPHTHHVENVALLENTVRRISSTG